VQQYLIYESIQVFRINKSNRNKYVAKLGKNSSVEKTKKSENSKLKVIQI